MTFLWIFALAIGAASVAAAEDTNAVPGCGEPETTTAPKIDDRKFGLLNDSHGCVHGYLQAEGRLQEAACRYQCGENKYYVKPLTRCLKLVTKENFQERQDSGTKTCLKGVCRRGKCVSLGYTISCQVPANGKDLRE
uniref:Evasin n=1 Tax=Amblyomma cajennense TaxID=34607 RepID=A0A023FRN9_AMBCJ